MKMQFPVDLGLPDYAESNEKMPWIEERLRKRVRDDTALRVLEQLGEEPNVVAQMGGQASDRFFQQAAYDINCRICDIGGLERTLPKAVHKQMELMKMFIDEEPHGDAEQDMPRREQSQVRMDAMKSQYLLGKFDNLALPIRADYDDTWKPQQQGAILPDCDQGFQNWFWVVHAAAPNIGESTEADDFIEYSREEGPRRRRLNEEMYLDDMGRIWRNCLLSMGYLGIQDAIFFPFGMGAFLRHLAKNDDVYSDAEAMRNLRYGIAAELFKAVEELCTGARPRGPARVHICLVTPNAESIENHNAFAEALAQRASTCSDIARIVTLNRNNDALQMAHRLAAGSGKDLKVALLNGANRKLIGNHWFHNGALNAIDENLHRRSASMARAALLVNMDTEARDRRPTQLRECVEWLGGKVLRTSDGQPLGAKKAAAAKASGSPAAMDAVASTAPAGICPNSAPPPPKAGMFGCCKRKAAPKAKPKDKPKAAAKQPQADVEKGGAKA